jgi:hypothetical protein
MGGRERTPLNRQCCTGVGVGTGISVSVGLIFASAYLAPIGLTREGEFSLALSRCFGLMGPEPDGLFHPDLLSAIYLHVIRLPGDEPSLGM